MTIALALVASLFIGVSDFLGGAASRTRSPLETSVVVFLVTLLTLVPITVLLGASDLTAHDLGLGAVSGLPTSIAYVGFFTAIGRGRISIVAPISAAMAALLPAIVGIAGGDTLSTVALGGVLCALVAIPLVSYEADDADGAEGSAGEEDSDDGSSRTHGTVAIRGETVAHETVTHEETSEQNWSTSRQVLVSILCGFGFGIYFVCIGHTHLGSGLWPTVASLVVALAVLVPLAARSGVLPTTASPPRLAIAGGVALGVADAGLTTALERGPLTVASVLGNLYPLVTITLGVTVLKERIRPWHALGILLALAGVAMIAAGQ